MRKLFFFSILLLFFSISSQAQDDKKIIQFSGIVTTGDSLFGLPGVHVYVPKSGRGTTTNEVGYFSMPALEFDSVIISFVGYRKQYIILPSGDEKQSYTAFIRLREDTTTLPEIDILPYPTIEVFKQAFLALELPEDDKENFEKNLEEKAMKRMMNALAMDGSANYKYYTQQEIQRIEQRQMVRVNSLLNPFAWVKLFKAIKNGDFKQDKDEDY